MTLLFDLYVFARATAAEHPVIAAILILISAVLLLPPVALAAFLGSPVLLPVALLLLVRQCRFRAIGAFGVAIRTSTAIVELSSSAGP